MILPLKPLTVLQSRDCVCTFFVSPFFQYVTLEVKSLSNKSFIFVFHLIRNFPLTSSTGLISGRLGFTAKTKKISKLFLYMCGLFWNYVVIGILVLLMNLTYWYYKCQ